MKLGTTERYEIWIVPPPSENKEYPPLFIAGFPTLEEAQKYAGKIKYYLGQLNIVQVTTSTQLIPPKHEKTL